MTVKDNKDREKNSNSKLILRVQKAKRNDIGRNIARIDQKTMKKLSIKTGDVIALLGKKESVRIAE